MNQINTLFTLNLYNVTCQLYLNKKEEDLNINMQILQFYQLATYLFNLTMLNIFLEKLYTSKISHLFGRKSVLITLLHQWRNFLSVRKFPRVFTISQKIQNSVNLLLQKANTCSFLSPELPTAMHLTSVVGLCSFI